MKTTVATLLFLLIVVSVCYGSENDEDFMKKTRPLYVDEIDKKLRVDKNFQLYFDGNKVITENKITFDSLINWAVVIGGLGAFISGVVDLICLFKKKKH